MHVPVWVWIVTVAAIAALVCLDAWQSRRPHAVGFGEAGIWSGIYIGAALAFAAGVAIFSSGENATEFLTGFLVEKTLSIDNLFIFALILSSFAVPAAHQSRVLLMGIVGALGMRVVFIVAGAAALEEFSFLFLLFGLLLVYTAAKLLLSHGKPPDVRNGRVLRLLSRRMPIVDADPERPGALLSRSDGRRAVTTLGLAVVAMLSIDAVFALDSIPAIFGITQHIYLVLCTNAFALLGLRALYFLLVGLLNRLVHLHYGLAIVLAFIGVKLALHYLHTRLPGVPEIPTLVSLVVILAVFAVTAVTSLRASRKAEAAPANSAGGH